MIGLPLTTAPVALLPPEDATTSVLPLALGLGSFIGIVITKLLPSIFAFIGFSPIARGKGDRLSVVQDVALAMAAGSVRSTVVAARISSSVNMPPQRCFVCSTNSAIVSSTPGGRETIE